MVEGERGDDDPVDLGAVAVLPLPAVSMAGCDGDAAGGQNGQFLNDWMSVAAGTQRHGSKALPHHPTAQSHRQVVHDIDEGNLLTHDPRSRRNLRILIRKSKAGPMKPNILWLGSTNQHVSAQMRPNSCRLRRVSTLISRICVASCRQR